MKQDEELLALGGAGGALTGSSTGSGSIEDVDGSMALPLSSPGSEGSAASMGLTGSLGMRPVEDDDEDDFEEGNLMVDEGDERD